MARLQGRAARGAGRAGAAGDPVAARDRAIAMTNEAWTAAFVGLGSNLDDPCAQLSSAARALRALPQTRYHAGSSVFRSAPLGPVEQPDFVNAVVALLTRLAPHALLSELLAIERAMGRRRDGTRWGPRRIDLDLLLYGDTVHSDGGLTLPHPGVAERIFVICPLAELAPAWRLPDGTRIGRLAHEFGCSQLEKIGELEAS